MASRLFFSWFLVLLNKSLIASSLTTSSCSLQCLCLCRVEVLKFVHPSVNAKGFPTKIAEHRLFFIAQPCVISQPSFLESLWFFLFPSILIHFFLINTLFFFCIIFLWFTLASIWSEKAFFECSNTFSMWHVKDCKVRSPRLVEHETYVFSRAWLKCWLKNEL